MLSIAEFDEKTKAVLMASLEEHNLKLEKIESGMHAIGDNVQTQKIKLEAVEGGMQSQKIDIVDIKQGVCNVIPDYQKEIKILKDALEHKTRLCDIQEGKTAAQTTKLNRVEREIEVLRKRSEDQSKREQALLEKIKELEQTSSLCKAIEQLKEMTKLTQEERNDVQKERKVTQEERNFAVADREELKQSIREVQGVTETLYALEERQSKRARL
jgi:chromosome segregation ATPase